MPSAWYQPRRPGKGEKMLDDLTLREKMKMVAKRLHELDQYPTFIIVEPDTYYCIDEDRFIKREALPSEKYPKGTYDAWDWYGFEKSLEEEPKTYV
jgi:hypothetical protein